MQIALNISGTPFELAAALTALTGIAPVEQVAIPAVPTVAPVAEKAKPKAPAAKVVPMPVEAEAKAEDPATDFAEENAPAEKQKPKKVGVEQLREIVQSKIATHREEVKAALKDFGAGKVTDLKPEDYIAFYTLIDSL